jgi:hypothetical protein
LVFMMHGSSDSCKKSNLCSLNLALPEKSLPARVQKFYYY